MKEAKENVQRSTSNVQRPTLRPERFVKRIERALRLGARIGQLAEKKRKLIESIEAAGLPRDTPVTLSDGTLWSIGKPDGKFVYFADLELKKVPKFKRAPKPESSAINVPTSELKEVEV